MIRPRILVLSHMYPRTSYRMGGVFVHEQVKELQRRGIDVAVLSGEPFWVSARYPIRFLRALRAWHYAPTPWKMVDGVPVMYFPYCVGGPFRNFIHALTYWQGVLRVMDQAVVRFPFDIIHAHTSFLDGYAAVRIGRRYGCPVVLTEHMGPFSVLARNMAMRYFTAAAVRGANRVFAVSQALRGDMQAILGPVAERVEVLGNGIDPAVFTPALVAGDGKSKIRMIWVGHVSPVKGVERLIEAAACAVKNIPDIELSLMGGGENIELLRHQADSLGIGAHLQFLPYGNRKSVAAAIQAHDFLVISSHKETFSLVALEALACGLPVLTTACGGPEDFIVSGQNGLIVPNSVEGLAKGIVDMAKLLPRIDGAKIADDVRSTRSWESVTDKLEVVYETLLPTVPSRSTVSDMVTSPEPRPVGRRILMITTDHLMIDRRILQEAESLRNAGHEVEILAGFECQKPETYEWRGIKISRFSFDWHDKRAQRLLRFAESWQGARIWPYLWRATCAILRFGTGITSFEHFVLGEILTRTFDVLHVHDYPLLNVGVAVKKQLNCQLVYDAHELYYGQRQLPARTQRRYRRQEKRLIPAADAVITVNPYIADIMARIYGGIMPHVVLNAAPLPEDTHPQNLRRRLNLSEEARIVLYQGWMSHERGIDTLVRAGPYFPAGIHLILVGYGECETELKSISRKQGTDDGRVIFMGRMEPEELAAITRQADLGVIPYRPVDLNHLYCSPNKLFEFVVAGIPFLANDLPFLSDVAEEYGFGIITDMNDPKKVADAIISTFSDSRRFSDLKSAARAAGTRLNWEIEAGKLLEIYEGLGVPSRGRQASWPDEELSCTAKSFWRKG